MGTDDYNRYMLVHLQCTEREKSKTVGIHVLPWLYQKEFIAIIGMYSLYTRYMVVHLQSTEKKNQKTVVIHVLP